MLRFEKSTLIHAPAREVFDFHRRPDVFALLTPPWQKVTVVRREGGLEAGAEVEFLIHAGPFGIRWLARHAEFEDCRLFTDVQVMGPFRRWTHQHIFASVDGGCLLTDSIEFSLKGGAVVDFLFGGVTKLPLRKMFDYRHSVTKRCCETGGVRQLVDQRPFRG